jgi:AraC-like DNA-binding protein
MRSGTNPARLPSVGLVAVRGVLLFEVRRLLNQWVHLLEATEADTPVIAMFYGNAMSEPAASPQEQPPTLRLGLGRNGLLPISGMNQADRYDLADPVARLSLLARVACIATNQEVTEGNGAFTRLGVFRDYPLYEAIATIQRVFDLHLTEKELLYRTGMSASSFYRLFRRDGDLAPTRLLQWVRMYEVARQLQNGPSLEQVAERLGFAHAKSVRRTLSALIGIQPHSLRNEGVLREFERRMLVAFGPPRRWRQ